jgi:hypothetical protein
MVETQESVVSTKFQKINLSSASSRHRNCCSSSKKKKVCTLQPQWASQDWTGWLQRQYSERNPSGSQTQISKTQNPCHTSIYWHSLQGNPHLFSDGSAFLSYSNGTSSHQKNLDSLHKEILSFLWMWLVETETGQNRRLMEVADVLQLNLIQKYFWKMKLGNYTQFTRLLEGVLHCARSKFMNKNRMLGMAFRSISDYLV